MKNLVINLKPLGLIIVLFSLQFTLWPQETSELFTPVDKMDVVLSSEEEERLTNQESNLAYRNVQLVRVGTLIDFLSDRELSFNIPGLDVGYSADVKEFEYESADNYKWRGNLFDFDGSIVLFSENGNVFGHIVIENQEYSIQTLGSESVFLEYDMDYVLKRKCAVDE